jgi:hypothetical protein
MFKTKIKTNERNIKNEETPSFDEVARAYLLFGLDRLDSVISSTIRVLFILR